VNKNPEILSRAYKISFSNGEFGCKVLGNGSKKLISFHGFGQNGLAYLPLAISLKDYTIFSLELPFHGSTQIIDKNLRLMPDQLIEVVSKMVIREEMSEFSLAGFSIGARLLYPVIQKFAGSIERVILIAPDGITENIWYKLATRSGLSRSIFRKVILNHHTFTKLIAFAMRFKIIGKATGIFAERSAHTNKNKEMVYDTWCFLRDLRLDVDLLARVINKAAIEAIFVIGLNDHIIRKKHIVPLLSKLDHFELIELPSPHHKLINKYSESIIAMTPGK
jgi:pimeloyl-ACP methyl ester carboxylesterase